MSQQLSREDMKVAATWEMGDRNSSPEQQRGGDGLKNGASHGDINLKF